jgi:hypothetical protein
MTVVEDPYHGTPRVTCGAGIRASETPTWSSFYTRKPKRRSSNPLINPPLPSSIFPLLGQVANCSPRIKPPNYPFIERYSSLSNPKRDSSFAVSNRRFPLTRTKQVVRRVPCLSDMDGDSGPFGYIVFAFSSNQTDAFFIQALPLLSPAIWGVPPHSLSVFVSFGSTSSELILFYYPLPPLPLPHLTPIYAPLVRVPPSWSRIYASFFMHLTRYMIHVF